MNTLSEFIPHSCSPIPASNAPKSLSYSRSPDAETNVQSLEVVEGPITADDTTEYSLHLDSLETLTVAQRIAEALDTFVPGKQAHSVSSEGVDKCVGACFESQAGKRHSNMRRIPMGIHLFNDS